MSMVLTPGCPTIVWSLSRKSTYSETPAWPSSTQKRKEADSIPSNPLLL